MVDDPSNPLGSQICNRGSRYQPLAAEGNLVLERPSAPPMEHPPAQIIGKVESLDPQVSKVVILLSYSPPTIRQAPLLPLQNCFYFKSTTEDDGDNTSIFEDAIPQYPSSLGSKGDKSCHPSSQQVDSSQHWFCFCFSLRQG